MDKITKMKIAFGIVSSIAGFFMIDFLFRTHHSIDLLLGSTFSILAGFLYARFLR